MSTVLGQPPRPLLLSVARECWPIAGAFTIARGSKTEAEVVVVTLTAEGCRGRGECVPYPRYGETVSGVVQALEDHRGDIERGLVPAGIPPLALPRAAANALDCALWDLEAKLSGEPAWRLLGLSEPQALITAYTLSLDTPE
ncbi:MAG: dipeptide epimerase, partial [Pseudomonadota bacterium]|nr:dipeptide epimerase [Pseudomonadota bacterium]